MPLQPPPFLPRWWVPLPGQIHPTSLPWVMGDTRRWKPGCQTGQWDPGVH